MAIKKRKSALTAPDATAPDKIIAAATSLFARQGYDGTSTKNICAAARVNIAAIHYHFGSKEQLYCHIIERFGGSRLQSVQRILLAPETQDEMRVRLQLFLNESIDVCVQQPELCRIVQVEIELMHSRSEDVFRKTFVKLFETLIHFITHAKKKKLVAADVEPRVAAQFLFNQIRQVTRCDPVNTKFFGMSIRHDSFRELWLQQTLQMFLRGIGALPAPKERSK